MALLDSLIGRIAKRFFRFALKFEGRIQVRSATANGFWCTAFPRRRVSHTAFYTQALFWGGD
jgi:hypothetical protein